MSAFKDGTCIKMAVKTCLCFLTWCIFRMSKPALYIVFPERLRTFCCKLTHHKKKTVKLEIQFQWSKSWEQYNCWKPGISGYLREKYGEFDDKAKCSVQIIELVM